MSRWYPGSGEVGRLAVGGYIPLGYYKDEKKSDATFLVINGERWSVPGDFASVEADGTITLLGRGSVVINSGGEKIFPEEVEEAVKVHPAVADCLVVGVPDERFGEAVIAVVALRPGETATADDLAAALEPLARFKRPRRYVFVDEVVRGPNGKADYKWAKAEAAKPAYETAANSNRRELGPDGAQLTPVRVLGVLLLLLGALLLREHVAGAEDQEVLAVDGDLGAAVLRVDDGVADREVDRDELATVLGPAAGTDREDFALLGLLLRGVGNDEAAVGRLLGLCGPDDDSVLQRLQVHRCASIYIGKNSGCEWRLRGVPAGAWLALAGFEC